MNNSGKKILTTNMSEEDLQKLVKFLGFTHDIGKSIPAFQTQPSYGSEREIDDWLIEQLIQSGFTELNESVLLNVFDKNKSPHGRAGEAILEFYGVPESVSAIVGAHHGMPDSKAPLKQIKDYPANYWQSQRDAKLQKPWQTVQRKLVEVGVIRAGYESVKQIPAVTQPQAIILEGLLITADWLASSEFLGDDRNKVLFPLISIDESVDDIDEETRFRMAMMTWSLEEKWQPQKITITDDPYIQRWRFSPRPVQKVMTTAISKCLDPGICIIEAPMGIGKTEIALVAAEQLAYKSGSDGIFFGLPTQATSNAMFERVDNWLTWQAHAQDTNFSINLMHGKAKFNPVYQNLPTATNVQDTHAVTINSWFSGKKSILAKFSVGTVDNLLLMGLKQRHLFLRHIGLSDKVVILDEVHAFDGYMNQYLYRALNWLGTYHVPVVILSATLPKTTRNQLLQAYFEGKYNLNFKKVDELNVSTDWRESEAYPLLTILDGNQIKQVAQFQGVSDQKNLQLTVQRLTADDESLIQAVLNDISEGGVAGIIVNTVKRAQKLADIIPASTEMVLIHSALLASERVVREQYLQKIIGKKSTRPRKLVVIGTQVLEQSLDLDFDVMYTDIAPMDLILQRVGRLHRHSIERPKKLREPKLVVMGIQEMGDYGSANESIYEKYLLMKTDDALAKVINLPTDISRLVQRVYDFDQDPEISGILEAKQAFEHGLREKQDKAKVFRIDRPKFKKQITLHGWLSRSHLKVDQSETRASAAVRDIQETLEVILIQHTDRGNYLMDGRLLENCLPKEVATQVIRLPAATTREIDKVIRELEKQTSQLFPEWQNSKWLKGALSLPVDENKNYQLGEWQLHYSTNFGLSYEREGDDGSTTI
jgi:CRISPR-associated endonuclease/helicase Cas3